MTIQNLYQGYLVADMLTKRLAAVGLTPMYAMTSSERNEDDTARVMTVTARADYEDADGNWLSAEQREAKVNEFLERFPGTTIERLSNYGGAPEMKARGTTATGVRWEITFGSGVCERIQVGTKQVERLDPAVLAEIPRVMVEEPVYEYRCPDPILAAGLVTP